MCTASAVLDSFKMPSLPSIPPNWNNTLIPTWLGDPLTEHISFKPQFTEEQVKTLLKLIMLANRFDIQTNQPECHDSAKAEKIKEVLSKIDTLDEELKALKKNVEEILNVT